MNRTGKTGSEEVKRFMFIDGRKQKPSRPSLSVGTIVYKSVCPKSIKLGNEETFVKIVSFDIRDDSNNDGIVCNASCLQQLEGNELELLSAIQRNERYSTLTNREKFNPDHLSVSKDTYFSVIHPITGNKVQGRVICETSRPNRMGTWWKMNLDGEVILKVNLLFIQPCRCQVII